MLNIGDTPENFTLLDQDGQSTTWSDFRGRPVVVFFYPRANTPGCTKEACGFRDLNAEFEALGAAVIGMSADSVRKQKNWHTKHGMTFPLLADESQTVLAPWGVWGEKKMYGKTYEGIVRSTFLFDADGCVVRAWPKVRVTGHVEEVLEAVRDHVKA